MPSGVLLTLMQWGGRVHFLLAVVDKIDEVCVLHLNFCIIVPTISIHNFIQACLMYEISLMPLTIEGSLPFAQSAAPQLIATPLSASMHNLNVPFAVTISIVIRAVLLCEISGQPMQRQNASLLVYRPLIPVKWCNTVVWCEIGSTPSATTEMGVHWSRDLLYAKRWMGNAPVVGAQTPSCRSVRPISCWEAFIAHHLIPSKPWTDTSHLMVTLARRTWVIYCHSEWLGECCAG